MKETALVNCVSLATGSFAIAVACKVTKSAWPLLAFLIVPTFSTTPYEKGGEENK